MGYGIIQIDGKTMSLKAMGILKLDKYSDHSVRLKKIFERTLSLIDEFKPETMAVEAPFFGKNIQSMLKLGRAQGVAIASAMYRDVPVAEYSPKRIKQSITGNGNASKEQVAEMLKRLLSYSESSDYFDATDGLAAAVCHYFNGMPSTTVTKKASKGGGWSSFMTNNPDRIVK